MTLHDLMSGQKLLILMAIYTVNTVVSVKHKNTADHGAIVTPRCHMDTTVLK